MKKLIILCITCVVITVAFVIMIKIRKVSGYEDGYIKGYMEGTKNTLLYQHAKNGEQLVSYPSREFIIYTLTNKSSPETTADVEDIITRSGEKWSCRRKTNVWRGL